MSEHNWGTKQQEHKDFNSTQADQQYKQPIGNYLKNASVKNMLTVPVIWLIIVPTVILDIFVTMYQAVCFSVYGIPKVIRADYIVFDRHHLRYLNFIEKINCLYCSYFNGCIAYIQEIAARTEQYWCPIKHAHRTRKSHSRYEQFLNYGDAKSFRQHKQEVRVRFDDLK